MKFNEAAFMSYILVIISTLTTVLLFCVPTLETIINTLEEFSLCEILA